MESFESPESEERNRIQVLDSLGIMDSSPELCFDQLALLASKVCDTPIALISFINTHRQWFKSSVGIDLVEIPKFLSACNNTILQVESYEIVDSMEGKSPYDIFMNENGFRYYGGVPISNEEDIKLGTLCVLDYKPRKLSKEQFQSLKLIAQQIRRLLQIRQEYKENLEKLNQLGEVGYKSDKYMQEIAHKAGFRSMAELSAGLSYRIKPLAIGIQTVSEHFDHDSKEYKILNNSTTEIIHLFDSLEKFISAEKEKSMKIVDIRQAVESVIKHLEYKIQRHDITIDYDTESLSPMCIGNISQIKESIFSVLDNAIEAVEHMKVRNIKIRLHEEDHMVSIKIEDSGRGISDNIAPFIFQPFFTTKGTSSLGIGLSLAQNHMQRHFGDLILEKPFSPTTFSLLLPKP